MLESRELTKKFGSKTAVNAITLKLEPGHIYAMMGPNGSGKTTWMKMAAGLIKPTAGTVYFNGEPVSIASRAQVAYLSTEPYFYDWMTIGDAGKYYADFFKDFDMAVYDKLIGQLNLNPKDKIKSLSSGMTAKMKVAVTLARDAKVYMLDEPFNGIDLLARDDIRACILNAAADNKLLLLSSHLVEEMENIADRAVFISQGNLIEVRDLEEMRENDGKSMADRYREIFGHTEAI
ncbi:MAG: ABC transporter ATP-binding protein [Clostridia bacterium]|nr:ABC transporter ATP-binding protein [Clostridia bacterium]